MKTEEIGNIIEKKILSFSKLQANNQNINKLNILVLGGSQAAKIFADILPDIFNQCKNNGVDLKIFQQCLLEQNSKLNAFYKKSQIEFETFNFSNDLTNYFSKANLAITRSGSSMLAELTNANIPFISIPLPTSADNHQFKNALYYANKNFSFLVEEKEINNKLGNLLKKIYNDVSILQKLSRNQSQYSDKNVYNNINKALKRILDEKN
jgi:UDP-N-acetylglucosamine--N-acetylmuramyl-(pentapeptide) pyrophosphoryl-undecaprenol N-acetylglucosamine transferase